MTVDELREVLEDIEDGDMQVRFAHQPNWPLEYRVESAVVIDDVFDEDSDEEQTILYLAEGEQLGYLPGPVTEHLGWR
jgi:hypothetical protein